MSVKATVTIELDGIKHELSMDDARDLWISLGDVLNPQSKKEPPKDPEPIHTMFEREFGKKVEGWGGIQPCSPVPLVPLIALQ